MTSRRVLLVDDEERVTSGLRRNLRKRFEIETCNDPHEALELVTDQSPPFSVVVSDYQMPGLNGIDFLAKVRELSPPTIRIMLTGQADLDASMRAVNEGEVFRFLTKPCPSDTLAAALGGAIRQFELEQAEKQLLEQTLKGTVDALVELVGLVDSATYAESARIRDMVSLMADRLELEDVWRYELAAVLSQLGTLTLPSSLLEEQRSGAHLETLDAALWARHPSITANLLSRIPRMELVSRMIAQQQNPPRNRPDPAHTVPDDDDVVAMGAHLLDIAIRMRHHEIGTDHEILARALGAEMGPDFRREVVGSLSSITQVVRDRTRVRVGLAELHPGMTLLMEVVADNGIMLLKQGSDLTSTQIERLRAFAHSIGVPATYDVLA